jgi:glycosidase
LNWEHPPVRDAVHEIIRFWLSRGIDGFRLDVINYISKPQDFPDSLRADGSEFYAAGPRLHEYLQVIGGILDEYNAFSVGEMPSVEDPNEIIKAVHYDRGELNMIFHFDFVCMDKGAAGKYSPRTWALSEFKALVVKWQTFMYANGGWNALYLENHDQPRSVGRFACDCPKHHTKSAKMLATFLSFQAGTLFIYEGQELGMTNVPKDWPVEEYKDLDCQNHWKLLKSQGSDSNTLKLAREEYQKKARDNARTPMQWTSDPKSGGFSASSDPTWMRVNPNTKTINAAVQVDDPSSPFSYWRSILAARKDYKDILIYGDFTMLDEKNEKLLAYVRRGGDGSAILVVCNFSAEEIVWALKNTVGSVKGVILSNNGKNLEDFEHGKVVLTAYEAFVVLLE